MWPCRCVAELRIYHLEFDSLEHGPFIDALPMKRGEFSIANCSKLRDGKSYQVDMGRKNVNPLTLLIVPFSILQGYVCIHSLLIPVDLNVAPNPRENDLHMADFRQGAHVQMSIKMPPSLVGGLGYHDHGDIMGIWWVIWWRYHSHYRDTTLVGGLEHEFYDFPYIGNNHPNWWTHIFQMGWNHQPAKHRCS